MSGSAAFVETWERFRALERTLGPSRGALGDWARGRVRYAVWLLRVIDPVVRSRMAAVAERLGQAIVPVPARDAHVTTWVCGFPTAAPELDDDVAEEVLSAQRGAAERVRRPRLLVGRPNAFATCAFLEVHDPHGDLALLRAALAVPGAREIRFAPYQPHVTVGRFADTGPTRPIVHALSPLREDTSAQGHPIVGCRLELVELDARAPERLTTVWPRRATSSGP